MCHIFFIHFSVDKHIGRRKGWSSVQSNSVLCYISGLQSGSSLGEILPQDFLKIAHFTEGNSVCRKMFWKNCELPRSRKEAWKECGCILQKSGIHIDPHPAPRSPHSTWCHHPPTWGREKGKLYPSQAQSHAIKDVAKMIHPLRILIPGWMRADLTTPGPELEPELLSASWLW